MTEIRELSTHYPLRDQNEDWYGHADRELARQMFYAIIHNNPQDTDKFEAAIAKNNPGMLKDFKDCVERWRNNREDIGAWVWTDTEHGFSAQLRGQQGAVSPPFGCTPTGSAEEVGAAIGTAVAAGVAAVVGGHIGGLCWCGQIHAGVRGR